MYIVSADQTLTITYDEIRTEVDFINRHALIIALHMSACDTLRTSSNMFGRWRIRQIQKFRLELISQSIQY